MTAAPAKTVGDAGLQPERTWLAWSRTSSAMLLAGLIGVRWAETIGIVLIVTALLTSVGAVVLGATQRSRSRRLLAGSRNGVAPPPSAVFALGGLVMLLGIAAAAVVAFS
ncbi:DUF202 domain-containing protein [Microbacterium sp. G2-8]|uniref:DUF202 domain-containing protein n=1 Tax=Microbacterium sp. G2-8 TaxID=2842454 RepID=UPI001C8A442D|nr:DUF202 domain-containing protein [Microbacterium sp. G2-8]